MKTVKNIALAIIVIAVFLISGCSKNETKNNVSEKEVTKQDTQKKMTEMMNQKTETTDDMNKDMKDMKNDEKSNKNIEHTMIKIPSSQCETCEKNLNKALKKVAGVEKFKVDIEGKVIHINYDKNVTSVSKIENAITSAGYDANDKKADPTAYDKLDNCCKKPEDRGKKN